MESTEKSTLALLTRLTPDVQATWTTTSPVKLFEVLCFHWTPSKEKLKDGVRMRGRNQLKEKSPVAAVWQRGRAWSEVFMAVYQIPLVLALIGGTRGLALLLTNAPCEIRK